MSAILTGAWNQLPETTRQQQHEDVRSKMRDMPAPPQRWLVPRLQGCPISSGPGSMASPGSTRVFAYRLLVQGVSSQEGASAGAGERGMLQHLESPTAVSVIGTETAEQSPEPGCVSLATAWGGGGPAPPLLSPS